MTIVKGDFKCVDEAVAYLRTLEYLDITYKVRETEAKVCQIHGLPMTLLKDKRRRFWVCNRCMAGCRCR